MFSKRQLKLIRSLAQKKHRDELGLFVAEGPKVVGDLLPHFECAFLGMTAEFAGQHPSLRADEVAVLSPSDLERASFLQAPRQVIAVFRQPATVATESLFHFPEQELCLALDTIQDPGNLGTIIRLADWFGIRHVFCSPETADVFSPKVIQATMGAVARVQVHYLSLVELTRRLDAEVPVYGTFLEGKNIHSVSLGQRGLLVMGNEGNGISPEMERLVTEKLFIPSYPEGRETSESLNVAMATAVVCSEFRRQAHR